MKKLLTAVLAASVISTNAAIGASAEEYVTVTFDPNGVEAFEPFTLKLVKNTAMWDEVNEVIYSDLYYDGYGDYFHTDAKRMTAYYLDKEGKEKVEFSTYTFDKDITLYAQWEDLTPIKNIWVVYDPDCEGMTVEEFLKNNIQDRSGDDSFVFDQEDSDIVDMATEEYLQRDDVLKAGQEYYVMLDFDEDMTHWFTHQTNRKVIGRDLGKYPKFVDGIDFYFTPQKWQLGNVDMKEPEKGVTVKDVMTLIQLANGNKKLSGDAQFMASDINQDYVLNYKDAMLAIREYKKPGSVIK